MIYGHIGAGGDAGVRGRPTGHDSLGVGTASGQPASAAVGPRQGVFNFQYLRIDVHVEYFRSNGQADADQQPQTSHHENDVNHVSTPLARNGSIDRIEFAFFKTGHALDAFLFVDDGDRLLFPGNGLDRAGPETGAALGTEIRIHFEFEQCNAALGRAAFLVYVGIVFVLEIAQRREDRVGSGLSQAAQEKPSG